MPRLGNDDPLPLIPQFRPETRVAMLGEIMDYNHDLMGIPEMWGRSMGQGVSVAVLDTGVPSHPDMTPGESRSFLDGGPEDENGHATAVGSVLAATAGNGMGVRGVAPEADDRYGKVLDRYGLGTVRSIVDGLYWAVDSGADMVNMSFGIPGGYDVDPELEKACDWAFSRGVCLFAAAGNGGDGSPVDHPARYGSVVAVSAVDRKGASAPFSSSGSEVEFSAGGVDVYMCYRNGGYASMSGTSFACPAVCGAGCLVRSAYRLRGDEIGPEEVRRVLSDISVDMGAPGRDNRTGYGMPVFSTGAGNVFGGERAAGTGRHSFWRRLLNAVRMLSAKLGNS